MTKHSPPDALDERGVLKDGQCYRLSLMLRDSLAELQKHRRPTYDATTICSDCSWSGDISIACPSCGKTNTDRADIRAAAAKAVQNTETHHESALEPAIANGDRASVSDAEFLAAGHRPGWRFNTDAAAKQRVLDAYKKADEERERAWKMGRDSDEREANTATLSQLPDVQSGSKVGDACNIGGVSGHMGYNDEGKLVCQLSEHAPASDDAINDRESAYRAYETDLQNSYKIPSLVADRQRKVQEYDPQGRESNSFISENGNDPDKNEAALSDCEAARQEYIRDLESAWKMGRKE